MLFIILLFVMLNKTYDYDIKYNIKYHKQFPKIQYTKIHDISYRRPIYIYKKRPYALNLFKDMNKIVNNQITEIYAMGSFPLSFTFSKLLNNSSNNFY